MDNKEILKFDVWILRENNKSILVKYSESIPAYLPLSKIKISKRKGSKATISLPRWLAAAKGWVNIYSNRNYIDYMEECSEIGEYPEEFMDLGIGDDW